MKFALLCLIPLLIAGCDSTASSQPTTGPTTQASTQPNADGKVVKTDAEWKEILTATQYYILREKGTERPFHNEYHDNHAAGIYQCAACGLELFSSENKFDSGTGWPSFYQPLSPNVVHTETDEDGSRNEVLCARCGGHLGHVFDDGPKPTGLRYCMNSGAMKFIPKK